MQVTDTHVKCDRCGKLVSAGNIYTILNDPKDDEECTREQEIWFGCNDCFESWLNYEWELKRRNHD